MPENQDVFESVNSSEQNLVHVEGGTLPHESDFAGKTVASFSIGRTPVTVAEWNAVQLWANDHGYSDLKVDDLYPEPEWLTVRHPVVFVSWYGAVKWCNAKSEMESRCPDYQVDGSVYRTGAFGERGSFKVWTAMLYVLFSSGTNPTRILLSIHTRFWNAHGVFHRETSGQIQRNSRFMML